MLVVVAKGEMSQPAEREVQQSFIDNEAATAEFASGPVESPPALLSPGSPAPEPHGRKPDLRVVESGATQLSLPLEMDPEQPPAPVPPEKRRRGRRGFVPVTRDPEVARSYSDNVALDYAIAQGLAKALSSLPPEELAALRAKVAQASRQKGRISPK